MSKNCPCSRIRKTKLLDDIWALRRHPKLGSSLKAQTLASSQLVAFLLEGCSHLIPLSQLQFVCLVLIFPCLHPVFGLVVYSCVCLVLCFQYISCFYLESSRFESLILLYASSLPRSVSPEPFCVFKSVCSPWSLPACPVALETSSQAFPVSLSLGFLDSCLCLLYLFIYLFALFDLFALPVLISTVLTQACFRPCKFVFSKQILLIWTHVVCDTFVWAQALFPVLLAQPRRPPMRKKQTTKKMEDTVPPFCI